MSEREEFEAWADWHLAFPKFPPEVIDADTCREIARNAWMARAEKDRWISVSERLPEPHPGEIEKVLISEDSCSYPNEAFFFSNTKMFTDAKGAPIKRLTHWRPLPEPPEQ